MFTIPLVISYITILLCREKEVADLAVQMASAEFFIPSDARDMRVSVQTTALEL